MVVYVLLTRVTEAHLRGYCRYGHRGFKVGNIADMDIGDLRWVT